MTPYRSHVHALLPALLSLVALLTLRRPPLLLLPEREPAVPGRLKMELGAAELVALLGDDRRVEWPRELLDLLALLLARLWREELLLLPPLLVAPDLRVGGGNISGLRCGLPLGLLAPLLMQLPLSKEASELGDMMRLGTPSEPESDSMSDELLSVEARE